ncbi:hypothetical protein GALL_339320 [mine drainage metagenome]|uniref:DUF4007 domain-containing protein n=1 Tax=mine drainage metagenome TaxID=410659 RepID=A0A1J5QL28_9ZZZZ
MWLKKAFDQADADGRIAKVTFTNENAIALFGVGKNMVSSIRHWAMACDVIQESSENSNFFEVSPIASKILRDGGLDPYAEHPTTAWHAHWMLAGKGNRTTTWRWLFNHVTASTFTRQELEGPLTDFAHKLDPKKCRCRFKTDHLCRLNFDQALL